MKHLFALALFALPLLGSSQLPNGSVAPDFSITDIDGVEHHLYSYLDSGYAVIIDFSATWCGPCWNYHTSGVFEDIYEAHGPDGTNEVRILFIESDDSTTDADLHGTGTNTWGDWTAGVDYPIADNGGNIFDLYNNAYYPTIYTVCPNRILQQTGQATAAAHIGYFQSGDCAPASTPNDVSLLEYLGPNRTCPETPTPLSIKVMNQGTEPLTAFTITASTLFGVELLSYDWTGNLDTYEMEVVDLGEAIFPSTSLFVIEVTSEDDYEGNNSLSQTMNLSSETATSLVRVRFTTDNMPGDNRWSITDDSGAEVAGIEFGDMTENQTEYVWWVNLDNLGCYTFDVYDLIGNGGPIACDISSFNADGVNINTIFTVNNNGNWTNLTKGFLVNEINTEIGETQATEVSLYPNPSAGQLLLSGWGNSGLQTVQIFDAAGKLVHQTQRNAARGVWALDIQDFQPGFYLMHISSGDHQQTLPFIRS